MLFREFILNRKGRCFCYFYTADSDSYTMFSLSTFTKKEEEEERLLCQLNPQNHVPVRYDILNFTLAHNLDMYQ